MSVTRINEFQAADKKEEELFFFLKSLVPYISTSNGCRSCEVLRDQESIGNFVVIEKWDSIDAHQASVANYPKEKMQAAMSLIGAPPKGRFYHA
jgi:heme oxygenase (mycobilin-producing)